MRRAMRVLALLAAGVCAAHAADAADLTVEQVRTALAEATAGHAADFSGKNLSELDLSGLDFSHANLAGADLFGAKLVGAKFLGANLRGARLDLAWIMRTDFSGADLSKVSLFGPVVSTTMAAAPASEAPRFTGADLSGARIIARFNGIDMRGARFVGARLGVDLKNQPMGQMRNDFTSSDLTGADLSGADINRAVLAFAKLADANLTGAVLFRADLSGADLTGADVTGADLTEADLDGTVLKDVKGLAAAKGFDRANNREKAIR